MTLPGPLRAPMQVALLAEGVGRNWTNDRLEPKKRVALLAEGVGRNLGQLSMSSPKSVVALLAEGVGRNEDVRQRLAHKHRRPPRGGRG